MLLVNYENLWCLSNNLAKIGLILVWLIGLILVWLIGLILVWLSQWQQSLPSVGHLMKSHWMHSLFSQYVVYYVNCKTLGDKFILCFLFNIVWICAGMPAMNWKTLKKERMKRNEWMWSIYDRKDTLRVYLMYLGNRLSRIAVI